jgi:hypothetical protein
MNSPFGNRLRFLLINPQEIESYSKESGPRGPGFEFTPEGCNLIHMEWWNDGTMEYWGENREVPVFLIMDSNVYPKMAQSRQPIIPTPHYSIIPVRLLPAEPTVSDLALRTRFFRTK